MARTRTHARTAHRLALFRRIDRHLTHPVAKIVHERRVKDDVSVNSVNLIRMMIQEKADPSLC